MASIRLAISATSSVYVICFLFLSITQLSLSIDVHDLLRKYGLPRGLLPSNVTPHHVPNPPSPGSFFIEVPQPCYTTERLRFHREVKGNIRVGAATHVSGIAVQLRSNWVPFTGVVAHKDKQILEFISSDCNITCSDNLFEKVPDCLDLRPKFSSSYRLQGGCTLHPHCKFVEMGKREQPGQIEAAASSI